MTGVTFIKSQKSQPKGRNMKGVKFVKAQKSPSQGRTKFFFSRGGENCCISLSNKFVCSKDIEEVVNFLYTAADARMPKTGRK